MKKTYLITIVLLLLTLILTVSISVNAANIEIGYGSLNGDTTYIIEDKDRFKSLLEFPLNVNIVNLKFSNDNFELNLASSAADADAGTFYDTDWYRQEGNEESIYDEWDIYSESKSDLTAFILDCKLSLIPESIKDKDYKFNLGYKYQNFDFMIHDVIQWSSYYDDEDIFTSNGNVLDYEVDYHIPYIELETETVKDKYTTGFNIAISPFVNVYDRDDHLLRDKLAYITASGRAINIGSKYTYNINKNVSFNINFDLVNIYTEGKQIQKNYRGRVLFRDIDAVIKSQQLLFCTAIIVKF